MEQVLGIDRQQSYEARLAALTACGVALWDVVGEAERLGSLDSSIVRQSVRYNPIPELVSKCPQLKLIIFNGGASEELFYKAQREWPQGLAAVEKLKLPSTSPANAALSLERKCQLWQAALAPSLE